MSEHDDALRHLAWTVRHQERAAQATACLMTLTVPQSNGRCPTHALGCSKRRRGSVRTSKPLAARRTRVTNHDLPSR